GRGVFRWHGKVCGKAQLATNRPLCQRKTGYRLEKDLANLWSRKKITKKAHAGRGLETIWEIPVYIDPAVNYAKYTKIWIKSIELWRSDDPDSPLGKMSPENQQLLLSYPRRREGCGEPLNDLSDNGIFFKEGSNFVQ